MNPETKDLKHWFKEYAEIEQLSLGTVPHFPVESFPVFENKQETLIREAERLARYARHFLGYPGHVPLNTDLLIDSLEDAGLKIFTTEQARPVEVVPIPWNGNTHHVVAINPRLGSRFPFYLTRTFLHLLADKKNKNIESHFWDISARAFLLPLKFFFNKISPYKRRFSLFDFLLLANQTEINITEWILRAVDLNLLSRTEGLHLLERMVVIYDSQTQKKQTSCRRERLALQAYSEGLLQLENLKQIIDLQKLRLKGFNL